MAPIGRPPILAVGHQGGYVFFQGVEIEFFQFFAVVEVRAQRIGFGIMLVQNIQIQCFWPPVHIRFLG